MAMKQLKDFLAQHEIMRIGCSSDNRFSEIIVDDWEAFIDLVYSLDSEISEISWWEKCLRSEAQRSLGGGGPIDPKDSSYYWSELPPAAFYYIVPEGKTKENIYRYINAIKTKYMPNHTLFPAFTISTDQAQGKGLREPG